MPTLRCEVTQAVLDALAALQQRTGDSTSAIVTNALTEALGLERATLFQVSSAGALVAGVTHGSVTVADLRRHGDFGIGTFDDFDGEMVVLDGTAHQLRAEGARVAADDATVPYAVVTNFHPTATTRIGGFASQDGLLASLDLLRTTDNDFFAVRADATFDHVRMRVVRRAGPDDTLVEAARAQAEFALDDVEGVLLGFWSPEYTRAMSVSGWHLHFIRADRTIGGHVLDARGEGMSVSVERLGGLHVAFPETTEFLAADLTGDHEQALAEAERD